MLTADNAKDIAINTDNMPIDLRYALGLISYCSYMNVRNVTINEFDLPKKEMGAIDLNEYLLRLGYRCNVNNSYVYISW